MDREELHPDVDVAGSNRFLQCFELDQVRDTSLASPAEVSSCWGA